MYDSISVMSSWPAMIANAITTPSEQISAARIASIAGKILPRPRPDLILRDALQHRVGDVGAAVEDRARIARHELRLTADRAAGLAEAREHVGDPNRSVLRLQQDVEEPDAQDLEQQRRDEIRQTVLLQDVRDGRPGDLDADERKEQPLRVVQRRRHPGAGRVAELVRKAGQDAALAGGRRADRHRLR